MTLKKCCVATPEDSDGEGEVMGLYFGVPDMWD